MGIGMDMQTLPHTPLIPAKAGIQERPGEAELVALDSRFRGNEREDGPAPKSPSKLNFCEGH
jgi:hypothetical protein